MLLHQFRIVHVDCALGNLLACHRFTASLWASHKNGSHIREFVLQNKVGYPLLICVNHAAIITYLSANRNPTGDFDAISRETLTTSHGRL